MNGDGGERDDGGGALEWKRSRRPSNEEGVLLRCTLASNGLDSGAPGEHGVGSPTGGGA